MGDRATASKGRAEPGGRPPGGRTGRRRLKVDERRDELISAALELLRDRPPDELSIEDVADAAGASRALVYHYFGGKQELYIAAMHRAAEQLSTLLQPPTEGRPLERLAVSLHRYFDFVEHYAAAFLALLRGGPAYRPGEIGELIDSIRSLVMSRVLEAIHVERPDPVLRMTLRSWMASVETAGLDWLEHRDIDRDELERLLVDHHVVLLDVAARHDPKVAALLDELSGESRH